MLVAPVRGTPRVPRPGNADPVFSVNAVDFDGSNDYLTRGAGLTGAADSKVGLVSLWYNPASTGANQYLIHGTADAVRVMRNTTGKFQVRLEDSAGTAIVQANSAANYAAGSWYHLLAAWDCAAATLQMYVNDANASPSASPSNTTIDYTIADWAVGGDVGGSNLADGDVAEVFFTDEYLDISVVANRRKFITAGLRPVDVGSDGSTPTGTAALIYLSGATSTWHTNDGSGGGFTENGALSDGADSPSDP